MANFSNCIARLAAAAGRALTDKEVAAIFERVHKAALDIKAGRVEGERLQAGPMGGLKKELAKPARKAARNIIQEAAQQAAADLAHEADLRERQAYLQVVRLGARQADVDGMRAAGMAPLDAVEKTIARDYTGRSNVTSLEQMQMGYKDWMASKLLKTWDALGYDFLGFFQDEKKLLDLVRELRGEHTGNALARAGADAFHTVAEEARRVFNENGGDIGRLDDWGMPQHHSQERVALAGKDAWIEKILPMLDRTRYKDDLASPWDDARMREFLSHAWDTIATNGLANIKPGEYTGSGKRANRHAEARQIHFSSAENVIKYWNEFGDRSAIEILQNHIDTMARDIAFIEHFGPNPNITYNTIRDAALKDAAMAEPVRTPDLQGKAVGLDQLWEYASGQVKPTYDRNIRMVSDAISHLNTAAKLGGAALASFFGDKPMMEAVAHMNDLPLLQRWRTELALLNPLNTADRRLIQQQGLMIDSIRSGLQRFYEGLGTSSSTTGKIANAVMRVTGMQAINDIRKAAFGLSLMSAIGEQIRAGLDFAGLHDSDIRALRNYGITENEWRIWKLAQLQDMGHGNTNVLTPEGISRITDDQLRAAAVIGQADGADAAEAARRGAIVKLLGAVNTESEFAIVTPGWRERTSFYGDQQRGTVKGEITRSVLQFKAFPWAFLQRGIDAVANMDGPASKAAMVSYLIVSTSVAGAMLMQTRDMLSGKDPRAMTDKNWYKFWLAAFLQGGALGIYGDFLYSVNQTRYGSGPLEALAGPSIGPILEMGIVQPLAAAKKSIEGKDTHLGAHLVLVLKGFTPGSNIWYTKPALDHMIWQRVMEYLSPGYLSTIREKTMKDYGQDRWWRPGEMAPERAPDLSRAVP